MKRVTYKAKEPVKIRFKKLSNGNQSIYLDCYKNGQRTYEFLKLYLVPEKTPRDKKQNQATLEAAAALKSKRIVELTRTQGGLQAASARETTFAAWLERYVADQKRNGVVNTDCIRNLGRHVEAYKGKHVRLSDIDKEFCLGLIDHLKTKPSAVSGRPLKLISVKNMMQMFTAVLNGAKRAQLIQTNPMDLLERTERVKAPQSNRVYLTAEELHRLIETPVRHEQVKQAFLFSCYCGLRISDIRKLTWADLIVEGEKMQANITMQKTKRAIAVPIPIAAQAYLPQRGNAKGTDLVFPNLMDASNMYDVFNRWAAYAGIDKHISFHTARHTFATLLLTKDVNLAVVQTLLGHADIKTTQVYAKVIDKKKEEAVDLLNNLFEKE